MYVFETISILINVFLSWILLMKGDFVKFKFSENAVKKGKKIFRRVIKLDKNFHVYIHSRHDFVEKGYDEEKGMKYYKLYYLNEE